MFITHINNFIDIIISFIRFIISQHNICFYNPVLVSKIFFSAVNRNWFVPQQLLCVQLQQYLSSPLGAQILTPRNKMFWIPGSEGFWADCFSDRSSIWMSGARHGGGVQPGVLCQRRCERVSTLSRWNDFHFLNLDFAPTVTWRGQPPVRGRGRDVPLLKRGCRMKYLSTRPSLIPLNWKISNRSMMQSPR